MDALIDGFDVQKIHEDGVRVLGEIGLELKDEEVAQKFVRTGQVRRQGNRLTFPEEVVEEYVRELRHGQEPEPFTYHPFQTQQEQMQIGINGWPAWYVDPETMSLRPFDTETVGSCTRLIDSYYDEGVRGGAAGMPTDVPPRMRQLMHYFVQCRYSRSGGFPGSVGDMDLMALLMEMGRIMEQPIWVGVESFSPLVFEGNSIEVATRFKDELDFITLDPLPVMGVSAPMDWYAGWAQTVLMNLLHVKTINKSVHR